MSKFLLKHMDLQIIEHAYNIPNVNKIVIQNVFIALICIYLTVPSTIKV